MKDYSKLTAPYFKPICRKVFSAYFGNSGFKEFPSDQVGIIFRKKDIFVRFYYSVEDYPCYKPMIDIGIIIDENGEIHFKGVGLWNVLEGIVDIDYFNWTFQNADELESTMVAIKDKLIENYIDEILNDTKKLEGFIQKKVTEIYKEYEEELRTKKLRDAEYYFKRGQHKEAVTLFEEIGFKHLSLKHQKMYKLAKK